MSGADDRSTLYLGDCLDVLRDLPDASVDAVVTDPPYCYWLAGLIDGEGCFRIQSNRARATATYAASFSLKLRDDDTSTLREVVARTGFGHLYDTTRSGTSNPCSLWRVDNKADCLRLVRLLDEYPLRSRKAHDFAVWRRAVQWWCSAPRGNRWLGARDWEPMVELWAELRDARVYRGRG